MAICCLQGYLRDTHLNSCCRLMIKTLGGTNAIANKTRRLTLGGMLISTVSVNWLSPKENGFAERPSPNEDTGQSMGQLKRASNTASMQAPPAAISNAIKKLTAMWPSGSGGPATRAKAEIWSNLADFNSKMRAMQAAADALIRATASSDLDAAKGAFGNIRRTCGGCHKVYRGPKL